MGDAQIFPPCVIVPAIILSVRLSIYTLKTCVGLDALTRSRHRSNRELVGQGLGNLATFFAGRMSPEFSAGAVAQCY